MHWLYIILSLFFLLPHSVQASTLSSADLDILDAIEEKFFYSMDKKGINPRHAVSLIQNHMQEHSISEKNNIMLYQLIDDIYYYKDKEGIDNTLINKNCYTDTLYNSELPGCYPDSRKDNEHDAAEFIPNEEDDDLAIQHLYRIRENQNIERIYGKTSEKHVAIRMLFRHLIPHNSRYSLTEIGFADNSNSDTDAFVEQTDKNYTAWRMVFNEAIIDEDNISSEETIETMLHEYGHILSFSPSQIQLVNIFADELIMDRYEDTCNTIFLPEGCLREGSYFLAFIDEFWTNEELDTAWLHEEPDTYSPEEYISEYATTNPGEDFAESFAHYILTQDSTGLHEVDRKIAFFATYPELQELRLDIRKHLQSIY